MYVFLAFENVDSKDNFKIFTYSELAHGYTTQAKYFTAKGNGGKIILLPQKLRDA